MKFPLRRLRQILRPPVIIFLVLILSSLLASYAVIYSTLAAHLAGDNIRFRNEYLNVDFPKSWLAFSWEAKNATSGNLYVAYLEPLNLFAVTLIRVYDETAARSYMEENNLADASSVVFFEATRMYEWSQQNNDNATLHFVRNATILVSNRRAECTEVLIKEGFVEEEVYYDLTCLFLAYIDERRLVQIAFWGKVDDVGQIYDVFETILGSVET